MNTFVRHKGETRIYIVVWLIIITIYVFDIIRRQIYTDVSPFSTSTLFRILRTLLPYIVLFIINNRVLIPRLLMRNRVGTYILATVFTIGAVWCVQYLLHQPPPELMRYHQHQDPPPRLGPKPLIWFPGLIDLTYDLLIVGTNLVVMLMFNHYYQRLETERRLKTEADTRLSYLKAQVSPHFYMNMLNNIHGLIDIDPEEAQQMVIDMSHMMRYMLYESAQPAVPLSREIEFSRNYITLMQRRYPADKVHVTTQWPHNDDMAGVKIPPLLFLVFIENAFKHGISYQSESWIDIETTVDRGTVMFRCSNSIHNDTKVQPRHNGIGLRNVRQRLSLIYGSETPLSLDRSDNSYTIILTLPADENTDTNN